MPNYSSNTHFCMEDLYVCFIKNKWSPPYALPHQSIHCKCCKCNHCLILQTEIIFSAKSAARPMLSIKLKLFWTSKTALSFFVFWSLEERLFPWCCDGRDSHCGAELQLMSERQRSIIGPVCACGGETVLCLCGLRLCLASLAGGRGRSIRASCFDTAQKRLWLWLLQSEHCPTVYHHTWQGKADHTASHTQTHITNLQRVLSLLLSFGRPWGLY